MKDSIQLASALTLFAGTGAYMGSSLTTEQATQTLSCAKPMNTTWGQVCMEQSNIVTATEPIRTISMIAIVISILVLLGTEVLA